jgi:hypothetical protein
MPTKKSQSNTENGRIQIFQDFTTLAEYTRNLVQNEPQVISDKALTYLACRNPKLWNKNEINLVVVLSRLEATLANLTSQQNKYLEKEDLLPIDIKSIKEISVACASVVTQLHTLTQRLGLSTTQLTGAQTRHEAANTNSREIADLVLSGSTPKTSTTKATSLAEARERSKQLLQDLQE